MAPRPHPSYIVLTSDALEAWIYPRGATLAALYWHDLPHSVVLGFADPARLARHAIYAGAIVGPVANRVAGGKVRIDGRTWQMDRNEGRNTLHSARTGLHARDWTVTRQSRDAVTLEIALAHGEGGLPGARRIEARYALGPHGTLDLRIDAQTDRPTVMAPAHHPYWALDGAPTVADHRLEVFADTWLPTDAAMLPTGRIAPVAGSNYDFRAPRPVPTDRVLDANLCLFTARRTPARPAATLVGGTGLRLRIDTTEPGLQVYNGAGLPPAAETLLSGQRLGPFAAIALEPQHWPDASHHAGFPCIALTPDAPYHQHTLYRLSR
ncbi:aldose epimerase family protein [Sulfitobacter sabulilitoris]|uniref:Galactose mutarotase n=1 Tax=Sulfitobacter sabulilitoris TaxID=2562655 RepID=A0A5S3PK32_9RHOB|nr:aldose epimerase family protein [Sulfitobacter sabulilitoris]TMM54784.1 galactose mutarotase [Sulfitobacter sabulilitoris]